MLSKILIFISVLFLFFSALPLSAAEQKKNVPPASSSLVDQEAYMQMADFLTILAIIRNQYVEPEKVTWKNLFNAAIRGLMQELDPYSNFESPEVHQSTKEDLSGKRVGIGVVISRQRRGLEIITVVPGSPADKSGIRPGDLLLKVNGESLQELDVSSAARKIRGDAGTIVKLLIYRSSQDLRKEIFVKRDMIKVSTVRGVKILPGSGGVGYIRLLQFGGSSVKDFDAAIKKLQAEKMDSLILDLRDNPGGLLGAAVDLCSRFIPGGKAVVSVERRNSKGTVLYADHKCMKLPDLPLVVLINGNSASSAEIFAACMRDYKRAVLIGEKSFGKGSVQSVIELGEKNGALRLTTARYFTPGRAVIHGNGIQPDITVALPVQTRSMLSHQLNIRPGEIMPLVPHPVRDIALARAVELLQGMRIFRGTVK
ncbi:MAG: S41 family peptidase [Lentisphaeria bacterium]|nr:S41 family peptidase [Lentisphaeria bacterium]